MRSRLTDIDVHVHHQTDKAILVSTDGDRKAAVWIPLATCEIEMGCGKQGVLTLEEDLAIEKGLV